MIRQLPAFPVTAKNKLWLATAVGLYTVGAYALIGEVAITLEPSVLPLIAVDRLVPLIPWTFWIYGSVYCIYALSCIFQRDLAVFAKFLWGYVFAYTFCAVFFLLFPTTFPRDLYPLGSGPWGVEMTWSEAAIGWFRTVDHPTNCMPSMHVCSSVMATAPFYRRRPYVFLLFCLWALAISVTTVTTKQHYALDVVAGAAYGLLVHIAFQKWVRFREST